MSCDFYLPVTGTEDVNRIGISVSRNDHRKEVAANVYPAISKSDGVVQLLIMQSERVVMEAMPRLNRKRLDALKQEAKQQIDNKSGPVWNAVLAICEKHKLSATFGTK